MRKQAPADTYDINKSDVFSNGLVLLAVALLDNLNDLYSPDLGEFNRESLFSKLIILKKRYPENILFLSTVNKMLDLNFNTRPTFNDLKSILPDFNSVK